MSMAYNSATGEWEDDGALTSVTPAAPAPMGFTGVPMEADMQARRDSYQTGGWAYQQEQDRWDADQASIASQRNTMSGGASLPAGAPNTPALATAPSTPTGGGSFTSPTTGNVVTYDAAGNHTDTGSAVSGAVGDALTQTPVKKTGQWVTWADVPDRLKTEMRNNSTASDGTAAGEGNSYGRYVVPGMVEPTWNPYGTSAEKAVGGTFEERESGVDRYVDPNYTLAGDPSTYIDDAGFDDLYQLVRNEDGSFDEVRGESDSDFLKHTAKVGALALGGAFAGGTFLGAGAGVGGGSGAFLGEGVASGVGAWDAAAGLGAIEGAAGASAGLGAIPVDPGSLAALSGEAVTTGLSSAAVGAAEQTIMEQLATQFGKQFTVDALSKSALRQAAIQLATTGKIDLKSLAMGTLVAPIGNVAGSYATNALGMSPGALSSAVSGAVSGGTRAALTGQDIGQGALGGVVSGAINPLIDRGMGAVTGATGSLWNDTKKLFGFDGAAPITVGSGVGQMGGSINDSGEYTYSMDNKGMPVRSLVDTSYQTPTDYIPDSEYAVGSPYVPPGYASIDPADYSFEGRTPGLSADVNYTFSPTFEESAPIDYALAAGQDGGLGLDLPTYPNLSNMGNGQGLTVETDQGTVGALGLAETGSSQVLGDPKSFINDPRILGNTVIGNDAIWRPDGTLDSVASGTPKKSGGGGNTSNTYTNTTLASKKREFADLTYPELLRLGFDPALIALLKGG